MYYSQGRMKTMKTWQSFSGNSGTAITTWNYDAYRGWLASKDYADASTGAAGTTGNDYIKGSPISVSGQSRKRISLSQLFFS